VAKPGHIYHWKHGWIPITPRAAMVKAKGRRSTADKYMHHYHIEDKRSGGDRRTSGPMTHVTGDARKHEDRGSFVYKPGTRTRDYPDRPGSGSTTPTAKPAAPKATKPAAPKATKPAAPKVKPATPAGESTADIQGTLPAGHVVRDYGAQGQAQYDGKGALVGRVRGPADTGGWHAIDSEQQIVGTYDTAGDAHRALAEKHTRALRGANTDAALRKAAGETHGKGSDEHVQAAKWEGNSIATTVGGRVETSVMKKRAWVTREGGSGRYVRVVGHFVSGSHYHTELRRRALMVAHRPRLRGRRRQVDAGPHDVLARSRASQGRRAGPPRQPQGRARARWSRRPAPTTPRSQGQGRQGHQGRRRRRGLELPRPAASAWRGSRTSRPRRDQVGALRHPHRRACTWRAAPGHRQPRAVRPTRAGDGTVVVIENEMDEAQTKEFMRNVTSAIERARPNLGDTQVKVYVPTHNEYMNRNDPGAFVYYGSSTVYVNPKMANGRRCGTATCGRPVAGTSWRPATRPARAPRARPWSTRSPTSSGTSWTAPTARRGRWTAARWSRSATSPPARTPALRQDRGAVLAGQQPPPVRLRPGEPRRVLRRGVRPVEHRRQGSRRR
jgi:hypothetical protein